MKTINILFILLVFLSASCVPFYENLNKQYVYDIQKGKKVTLEGSLKDWNKSG
jgi:hypothetical protein